MGIRPTFAPGSNRVYTIAQTPPPAPVPVHAPATLPTNYQQAQPHYAPPAPIVVQAPRPSVAPYVAGGIGAVVAIVTVGAIAIGLLLAFAVSALALAVVAAVLKSLLNSTQDHRTRR